MGARRRWKRVKGRGLSILTARAKAVEGADSLPEVLGEKKGFPQGRIKVHTKKKKLFLEISARGVTRPNSLEDQITIRSTGPLPLRKK